MKMTFIFLSTFIIYYQDFKILFIDAISNEIYTYFLLMPFLIGYILYRKRKIILASISFGENVVENQEYYGLLVGSIMCFISILLRLYGSYTFIPLEIHIISIPIFLTGSFIMLFNAKGISTVIFPFIYTIFLIPLPITTAQQIGSYLSYFGSKYSYEILHFFGFPVNLDYYGGTPIINIDSVHGPLSFSIDLACSGLYSLTGFIVFAVFLAYISRINYRKKIFATVLGIPIIYILNIIRITIIILVGYFYGESVALNSIHLLGGWVLTFIGTFLLFIILDRIFDISFFSQDKEKCINHNLIDGYCSNCGKLLYYSSKSFDFFDYVGISIIILVTLFSLFIQVPVFSLSENPESLAIKDVVSGNNLDVLPVIDGYELFFVYRDSNFEEISKQNASLMYQYFPTSDITSNYWVGLEIGESRAYLHPWEVCLVTSPYTYEGESLARQLDLYDLHLYDNPPITARYFAYREKNSNIVQSILYWYTSSNFLTQNGFQRFFVKISVIDVLDYNESYELSSEMRSIAENIINYWEPKSDWSRQSLLLVERFNLIVLLSFFLIILLSVYYGYLLYSKITESNKKYSHLNAKEKQIIDLVKSNNMQVISNSRVFEILQKNGIQIEYEILINLLYDAEEAGLLRRRIMNINDKPYLTWDNKLL
jgi:exosortase/archaeosortase family protein